MRPPNLGIPAPPNAYESGLQNINGIEISVAWDRMYGDYTIYFPQLQPDWARRIDDQVIRLSKRPEEAQKAFEYASSLAEEGKDAEEIYFAVGRLQADFVYDEDIGEYQDAFCGYESEEEEETGEEDCDRLPFPWGKGESEEE